MLYAIRVLFYTEITPFLITAYFVYVLTSQQLETVNRYSEVTSMHHIMFTCP